MFGLCTTNPKCAPGLLAPPWGRKDCLLHACDDINSLYILYRYQLWLYIYLIKWENTTVVDYMFHFYSMKTVQSTIYSAVICTNDLEFYDVHKDSLFWSHLTWALPDVQFLWLWYLLLNAKSPALHTVLNFLSSLQPKRKGEARNPRSSNIMTTRNPAAPQYVIRTVSSKGR